MHKRHLLFLHGYDLRGPKHYFRLMERELGRFAALRDVAAEIDDFQEGVGAADAGASWRLAAQWPDGDVEAHFHYLGWRDLARREFQYSFAERVLRGLATFGHMALSGHFRRVLRRNWMTGLFFLYPAVVLCLCLLLMTAPAVVALALFAGDAGRLALALAAAAVWASAVYRASRYFDRKTYFWYLVNDWIAIRRLAVDRDPEMERRIDLFARQIVEFARETPVDDEVVVVAHSSGAFVAVYVMARVLELDPSFGRGRRRPILLSVGSAYWYVGEFPRSARFDRALELLSQAESFDWVDVFAPQDIIACGRFDPVAAYVPEAVAAGGKGPRIISARFATALPPDVYPRLRWRFFDLHFGYFYATLAAAEGYDFYKVAVGPSLRSALSLPEEDASETKSPAIMR